MRHAATRFIALAAVAAVALLDGLSGCATTGALGPRPDSHMSPIHRGVREDAVSRVYLEAANASGVAVTQPYGDTVQLDVSPGADSITLRLVANPPPVVDLVVTLLVAQSHDGSTPARRGPDWSIECPPAGAQCFPSESDNGLYIVWVFPAGQTERELPIRVTAANNPTAVTFGGRLYGDHSAGPLYIAPSGAASLVDGDGNPVAVPSRFRVRILPRN